MATSTARAVICTDRCQGTLWIALSAAGFGAMAIFAKLAYQDGVSLSTMLFLRFTIAGLLLAAWGMAQGMRWPRGRDLLWLLAMGGVGYVTQAYCYFAALQHASAGMVALLLYLYPAMVTLLSALLYRRRIGAGRGWAVAVALAGTALTVGGDLNSAPLGIVLGIGGALVYSIYILAGEGVMRRVPPLPAATVVMLAAATVYGGIAFQTELALPASSSGWLAVTAIAVFSTLLAILGFLKGMEKLGATDASTLSTLEPLITLGLAALVLGEVIGGAQLAGGALILAAVVYLARHGARRVATE
ncbi:MAG: DMT family transporter [Rhodocyclaceae bacterium]|nr:DMT family transporter [Rhodocyclaceae bacterium]